MVIVPRAIGLVLFGAAMIVLEFHAFSVPWKWTLAQDMFVLAGLSVLLGLIWSRKPLGGAMPVFAITEPGAKRAQLRNLLLWLMIAAALIALFKVIWRS
jgi:hypothetical protein